MELFTIRVMKYALFGRNVLHDIVGSKKYSIKLDLLLRRHKPLKSDRVHHISSPILLNSSLRLYNYGKPMPIQDATKHDDITTPMVNVVVMTDDDDLFDSGRGTGASVGCHEMVGTAVLTGANVAGFGQQIASALRANSQSSDVLFNWITTDLAIPQVVSLEKGIMIVPFILTSLQNSHCFSTTGSVAVVGDGDTPDGAIVGGTGTSAGAIVPIGTGGNVSGIAIDKDIDIDDPSSKSNGLSL
jgi:hypothetical protein